MNILITIILILGISYLFTFIAKKLRIQPVVALIIAGLFLGIPEIRRFFIGHSENIILILGNIALMFLMFLAGKETSWRLLYKEKRNATFIAFFAFLTPFILGSGVFLLLGFPLIVSVIVGIAMSITAEATKARVLLDLKKLKTKIGAALMGAGIIDDVIGLFLFSFIAIILFNFGIKENFIVLGAISSFFAGIFAQKKLEKKFFNKMSKGLMFFVIPFFFISLGLHFNFDSIILNPFLLIIMIFVATIGKILGVFLTRPFTKFEFKQLFLMGWAMNSRGAIELALAMIAFRFGLLPIELYSSIIVMALSTTLIFPFVITKMIRKDPRIMER